jgi:hypothetical protein
MVVPVASPRNQFQKGTRFIAGPFLHFCILDRPHKELPSLEPLFCGSANRRATIIRTNPIRCAALGEVARWRWPM